MSRARTIRSVLSEDELRIAQDLRARRIMAGLTQSELGEALGVSPQQVSKYERGLDRVSAAGYECALTLFKTQPRTGTRRRRASSPVAQPPTDGFSHPETAPYVASGDAPLRGPILDSLEVIEETVRRSRRFLG